MGVQLSCLAPDQPEQIADEYINSVCKADHYYAKAIFEAEERLYRCILLAEGMGHSTEQLKRRLPPVQLGAGVAHLLRQMLMGANPAVRRAIEERYRDCGLSARPTRMGGNKAEQTLQGK